MDPIQELADQLAAADTLTDEQVRELGEKARAIYTEQRDLPATDETVSLMERAVELIGATRTLIAERTAAIEVREARLSELDALLDESEIADAADEAADDDKLADEAETVEDEVKEPVAAAAFAKMPKKAIASPARTKPRARMYALADNGSIPGGTDITRPQVGELMLRKWQAMSRTTGSGSASVVRMEGFYGDRDMRGLSGTSLGDAMHAAIQPEALTAAGGVCGPVDAYYEQLNLSQAQRPVRDGLTPMRLDRGGVRYTLPPSLANIGVAGGSPNQAVGIITEAQDTSGVDKTFQAVPCAAETEVNVDAIYLQLEFGVGMDRFSPERAAVFSDLSLAAHARQAESRLLRLIRDASITTKVVATSDVGAGRDLARYVNVAAAGLRNRHRTDVALELTLLLPWWTVNLWQDDAILSGFPIDNDARWTAQKIRDLFAERNIRLVFHYDGAITSGSGTNVFAPQADNALLATYPTTVQWALFPTGTFAHGDGGTLDLGIVRDAALVNDNSFRTFVETFETVIPLGVQAIWAQQTVCANGGYVGTNINPTDICSPGS